MMQKRARAREEEVAQATPDADADP